MKAPRLKLLHEQWDVFCQENIDWTAMAKIIIWQLLLAQEGKKNSVLSTAVASGQSRHEKQNVLVSGKINFAQYIMQLDR